MLVESLFKIGRFRHDGRVIFTAAALAAALGLWAGSQAAAQPQTPAPAYASALRAKAEPAVHWQPHSAIEGNFEWTAASDVAVLGTRPGFADVALVTGATGKVSLLEFARGGNAEDALYPGTVTLKSESLDYNPDVGAVPGFVRSKVFRGLHLGSGDCDDFHIFWNQARQDLDWWRN